MFKAFAVLDLFLVLHRFKAQYRIKHRVLRVRHGGGVRRVPWEFTRTLYMYLEEVTQATVTSLFWAAACCEHSPPRLSWLFIGKKKNKKIKKIK